MTNQITTRVSRDQVAESDWLEETNREPEDRGLVMAALGNTWSHCVNTRLLLQFMEGGRRMVSKSRTHHRYHPHFKSHSHDTSALNVEQSLGRG